MRSRSLVASVTFLVLFVSLGLTAANAQYRGSIQGTVTDEQGAVVPGAAIALTNKETGHVDQAASDELGIYNFYGLPPSHFSMTVEKAGFKKKSLEDLTIISEQANAVNVQLAVGATTETVTVNGDATPLIDTETSNLSATVKAEQFEKLPSFGRDPFQLLQLAPGAFGDGAQGAGGGTSNLPGTTIGGTGGTDGPFKIENGGQITANGARTGENSYQLDGVSTVSVTWGGTSVITPNEDSIKEVKIATDNYDAENGRFRGAQVQIISQNGTNDLHGSLFFKAHRPGLNAFTKYNGYSNGNTRDDNRFNNMGGSAGGPILRNRVFAFFSYESLDNNAQQRTGGGWYETSQFRALAAGGTNAAAFLGYKGVAANGGTQVDHDCTFIGLVEGTNCHFIAGQGLNLGSPLTAALGTRDAGYVNNQSPGTGGDGSGSAANLSTTPDIAFIQGTLEPSNSTHRQYNGRIDFNATQKDLLAFSIYYVPQTSTGINGNGDRLMNSFNSTSTNRAMTFLWDRTINATMANEARVNAAGWQEKDLANNPSAPWGLPQVSFNGTGSINVQGYGIGSFNGFDQWTYGAKDVLTKVHGAHTMKMGGEFTRLLSVDAPFWADRPGYTFNNVWDFLNDAPVQESAQFDPQTGVPSALRKDLRSNVYGVFFQDNYKLRPNFTLTAGLRWDYFGAISEKKDKLATVVFGSGANTFTDIKVRTGGRQYNPEKSNFGPQLGFAWSPGRLVGKDLESRLVLRGGVGISYNGLVQSNTLDVRFNPPFVDNGQSLSGNQILYINSFPSNVHNPNGYAANPNGIVTFGPNNLPLTGRIDLTALPANLPTTRDVHYTMGAEYDLGHSWVASVGYQGSTTRHLTQHYNFYNTGSALGYAFNPSVSGVTLYNNNGSSRFNALLLEVKHPLSRTFQIDTQYRLSKSSDPGSNAYAAGNYQWNLGTGYGPSDYDSRHAIKVFGIWSPTIFHGSRSWAEKVVGGWTVSGILNAHTGFPWTPVYSNGDITLGADPVFHFNNCNCGSSTDAGSGNLLPAAYVGGFHPNYGSNVSNPNGGQAFFTPPNAVPGVLFDCLFPNPDPTLCPTGQVAPGPIPSSPGVRRNIFYGPGYLGLDATLSKSFGLPKLPVLGENAKVEFRANFFNLFNRVNLASVQTRIFDPHFGEAQNGLGSRTIEMQARFSF